MCIRDRSTGYEIFSREVWHADHNQSVSKRIKTDKRNSFSINNIKNFKTKLDVTQFGRICEDLEIELKCNSNYLFKPNTERENGTFKRRLKAELRHEGVINIDKWLYK